MKNKIENFDKLETDIDRDLVERLSQFTTVTINDDEFLYARYTTVSSNIKRIFI